MNYTESMNKPFTWYSRSDRLTGSLTYERPTALKGSVDLFAPPTTTQIEKVVIEGFAQMPRNEGRFSGPQPPYKEVKSRLGRGRRMVDRHIEALEKENADLRSKISSLENLLKAHLTPVTDPLASAVTRGAEYMRDEFFKPENLSLQEASVLSGRSERTINQERNRGSLYALLLGGNTRGYRYPKWQFDVEVGRLRPILDILRSKSFDGWPLHNFLITPHSNLDNLSPSAAIADEKFPLERIAAVARIRVDPHQGAT
jgi:hypothetical protein